MERSGGGGDREDEIWGTLEELLLVCAVDRHGPQNWDSVAAEIQSRTPYSHLLTPQSCRNRYLQLRQRFSGAGTGEIEGEDGVFPWLDELRKLRVTELRRDVERSDRSIGSLQLKVKRLEEERARETTESGEDKPENAAEDGERSPETVAGDRISGRDSGGPSCEESNSTDPKKETNQIDDIELVGDLAVPAAGNGEKVTGVALGEGSCNGSTEGARVRVGGESGESIAESKGGGDGEEDEEEEENSDVQSSASLSRRRRKAVSGSSSGGEEAEAEAGEVSKFGLAGEVRPLVSFLESVRSKYGSVFDRRLEIQESDRYRCLIRRHVDFDTVRSKIDRIGSGRPYAAVEFFRDLLLLCTNAIVFYPKDSTESRTAVHLRRLILSEMSTALPQLKRETLPLASALIAPTPSQPKIAILKPKPDPDVVVSVSLLDKPSSSAPLIVCRKRSSINKVKEEKEKEKEREEKEKESEQKVKENDEKNLLKNTKERSLLTGTRSLRTKKKPGVDGGNAAQVMKRPVISPTPSIKTKHVESSPTSGPTGKAEKKCGGGSNSTSVSGKKNKPAVFLSRIKRSAAGSTLMESLKNSPPSGGSGKGSEHKKGSKSSGDNRKEQGGSQNTGTGSKKMVAVVDESNSKRTVGRPPKRMAPLPTPPPAKRAKEETETLKPAASKKKGRR